MTELDSFIAKFGGYSESYWFYGNTVELVYDKKNHVYLLVTETGLVEQPSVTTIVKKALDKSEILIPWGCKRMGEKLNTLIAPFPFTINTQAELDDLIKISKRAHKETLEEAGNLGTKVHDWIEAWIRIQLGLEVAKKELPEELQAKNAIHSALDWMTAHNVRWLSTERKIYSKLHRYAGTLDGLAYTDSCADPSCCPNPYTDHLSVIDWKTSNSLYLDYIFQVSAYYLAYSEESEVNVNDAWIIRLGKEEAKFETWYMSKTELDLYSKGFVKAKEWFDSVSDAKANVKARQDEQRMAKKLKKLDKPK